MVNLLVAFVANLRCDFVRWFPNCTQAWQLLERSSVR